MRKLDAIRKAGAFVQEISLAPLASEDLGRLIADTLSCMTPAAAPLGATGARQDRWQSVFAIQFISALAEEGLLRFDHDAARWRWELDRLHAKGYTDNVADFMVGKLTRLPLETQVALQQLACLGNVAEITLLSIVLGKSDDAVRSDLWDAVRLELVEQLEGSYKFIHDRIQEAAYSLIPDRLRAEAHLSIGRLIAVHTLRTGAKRPSSKSSISSTAARLDHLTRRARAAGRAQPARGPARQGLCRLRLGAHLSGCRCGPVAGRLVAAPA